MSLKRKVGEQLQLKGTMATTKIEKEEFSFFWDVQNFPAMIEKTFSPIFIEGEKSKHEWKLSVKPKDLDENDEGDTEWVGVYLKLERSSNDEPVELELKISLVDSKMKIFETGHAFHKFMPESDCGFAMILRSNLLDPANDYLEDGHILKINCEGSITLGWNNSQVEAVNPAKRLKSKEADGHFQLLKTFLNNAEFADAILKAPEKEFPVSKIILAAQSPVFRAMFNSLMLESTENIVNIEDFSADVVGGLLEFMYTGQVALTIMEENVEELLRISDKYQVDGLKDKCEEALEKKLSNEIAVEILILAYRLNASQLKAKAISFVARNRKQIQGTASFNEMSQNHPEILRDLFSALE